MKYIELNFMIEPFSEDAADVLAAELAETGCETFLPTPNGLMAYLQADCLPMDETGRRDTRTLDEVVEHFPLPDVRLDFTMEDAPDEDWNATWEASGFEPICIGNDLFIYDDRGFVADLPSGIQHCVKIRPCQAFGTGSHQTTQMVLKALSALDLKGATVIDAGCGTGILGIVAALRGARKIFAYDIDEWSVRNANENFNINNIDGNVRVILEGDSSVLKEAPMADVIVANIHRNIILNDMAAFVSHLKLNGVLIISGFLNEDVKVLTDKAISLGLQPKDNFSHAEWQCLMFKVGSINSPNK